MALSARRLFKVLGFVLLGLVVVATLAYGGVVWLTNSMMARAVEIPAPVQPIAMREGDPSAIARGDYLVNQLLGCRGCHAADFGGRAEIDDPMVGTFWAPNLTNGKGSATLSYTPVDWARAIRHGVAPDGHRLVVMPSEDFYKFSDDDVGAIVAYIRSMPDVDRDDRGIKPGPLGRVLLATGEVTFAFDKIDHAEPRSTAPMGATKEWGSVLAGACQGCHGGTLSGGRIPGTPPEWPAARNLTPHETGLKNWTFEQFSDAFRKGVRPDGTHLSTVMPWQAFAGMTDTDVQAIWAYLQSLTPREQGGR